MLQWATKILQTCETLCFDVQCQKWKKLSSVPVYRSKVGPKGQFWSSPWATCCLWFWSFWLWMKRGFICNTLYKLKPFHYQNVSFKMYLRVFLTCRHHWLNEFELQRESKHLFYLDFSPLHYRMGAYHTQTNFYLLLSFLASANLCLKRKAATASATCSKMADFHNWWGFLGNV